MKYWLKDFAMLVVLCALFFPIWLGVLKGLKWMLTF